MKKSLAGQGLKAGDVGTVIHVYKAGEAFEVEFLTLHGEKLPFRPWKLRRFVRCKKEKWSDGPGYGNLQFGPERLSRILGRYSRLGV